MAPNPWLEIPLADYEAHMELPQVAQASLLGDILADLLRARRPASVAVLGCAGGNGFERIDPAVTRRVVGVDLNPGYVAAARSRFSPRFACFEALCGDVEQVPATAGGVRCEPVALVYAALLFEYVEPAATLRTIRALLAPDGVLAVVLQEPSPDQAAVTPSPYTCLGALATRLRHVEPDALTTAAAKAGLVESSRRRVTSAGGKSFTVQTYLRGARPRISEGRSRMDDQLSFYEGKLAFEIDSYDLNELRQTGDVVVVIDARSAASHAREHIPGAINLPHREMNAETTASFDRAALYITYCDGIGCNASTKGALAMSRLRFRVKELIGGLEWWKRDGFPTSGPGAGNDSCGCG